MKAGRELDALIAEKVMGIPVRASEDAEGCYLPVTTHPDGGYYHGHRGQIEKPILHYSTQIADAWLVVECFQQKQRAVMLHCEDGFDWSICECKIINPDSDEILGECRIDTEFESSMPLAICLAALKAVENK